MLATGALYGRAASLLARAATSSRPNAAADAVANRISAARRGRNNRLDKAVIFSGCRAGQRSASRSPPRRRDPGIWGRSGEFQHALRAGKSKSPDRRSGEARARPGPAGPRVSVPSGALAIEELLVFGRALAPA